MAPPSTPITGFDRLSDAVSISRSNNTAPTTRSTTNSSNKDNEPSLLVYCAWMGAASKHIQKYTSGYRTLYPSATILLVENTMQGLFSAPDLSAAHDVITAHLASHPPVERADGSEKTGIVLAMASNGGAINGVRISNRLCHIHERAPFDAIVLDCSPSFPRAVEGARALAPVLAGGSSGLLYLVAYWVLYFALIVWGFVYTDLLGNEDLLVSMRKDLNSVSLFPRVTPRLYMYSKKDLIVNVEDVRSHAEEARKRKYVTVREEVFSKASHVALLTEDQERYWRSIKEIVNAAR